MTSTAPQPAAPPPGTYITALPVAALFADPTYQRDLDEPRVAKMSGEYDHTLLGVLEVSERDDGRFAILDGQHRWATVARINGEHAHVVCNVHAGLSIEDEACLFHEIDTSRRNHTWWDRWRARRGMADSTVLAIDEVLHRHQLQVNPAPADGNIRATKALETIVDDLGGLQMLDNVLIVLTSAFGRSVDAFDGGIMQGVALVLGHYDADELHGERLVAQLSAIAPRQLRARAVALREAHRGTVPRLSAAVIVERYNAARGCHLEPFFTRVPSASKAGAAWNRERKERAAIRRWAEQNGYDLARTRNIPPSVRRAYQRAQATAGDPSPDQPGCGDSCPTPRAGAAEVDPFEGEESPEVGVPDRAGIMRAFERGRGVRFVMDAWGLDYQTAQALLHVFHASRAA
ncbi:Lsr2 family protein [Jatrophihabitans cynanchi]|uniref:Lsr2 family protein n=1 Tax=Jatrophihabitans cynanchi TaxID=2944128 RepID=A0ABY7K109_9ACTN|nr:DUF6551 family protein [Jatrophihabitans sp. SB3-54]WAX58538.1 Lsr2 family protein [Jatrophihabitans sp. SB3-54]